MSYAERDAVVCDRCGMYLFAKLAQFHRCNGTDMSKRPANVSVSEWTNAVNKALGVVQVPKGAEPAPKSTSKFTPIDIDIPDVPDVKGKVRWQWVLGVAGACALWIIILLSARYVMYK